MKKYEETVDCCEACPNNEDGDCIALELKYPIVHYIKEGEDFPNECPLEDY